MSDDGPAPYCPLPRSAEDTVQLAHGGGGRLMRELIETMFLPAFENPALAALHDSAVMAVDRGRLAFSTDAFVVTPLSFPGGDIGKLAVCGTINDLAMSGARPLWLSASFIIEEGLPLGTLQAVLASMRASAMAAGVSIVAGDTKVVDRGKGDGLFISTSGIGVVGDGVDIGPRRVVPGDCVLVSGDLGRHGVAVLSVREGLEFEGALESDCAALNALVGSLLAVTRDIHCLRDLTRGGLASALNEIAVGAGAGIELAETAIPVAGPVRGACELLGLDPLYVANEGRMVIIAPASRAEALLAALKAHALGAGARLIGRVTDAHPGTVVVSGSIGGERVLDMLAGDQLPRIC